MARKPLVMSDARAEFKDLTFEAMAKACIASGNAAWLQEAMNRQMPSYKWQKTTIVDEATGKKRKVIDKTKPKVMELRKPTFIQLKEMYLVEIVGLPAADKSEADKPVSMADKFAALLAEAEAK